MAASTSFTRTYDSILSTSAARVVQKKAQDQTADEYPGLDFFMGGRGKGTQQGPKPMLPRSRKGRVVVPGGQSIRVNVRSALNDTAKYLQGNYEQAALTPQDNVTLAQYEFRQIIASITISNMELLQNQQSDTRIANLLDEKVDDAFTKARDFMSSNGIYSDGTAAGNNQITGLQAIVSTTGTLAQIARGTETYWQSNSTTTGSFAVNGLKNMATAYNTITRGSRRPDIVLTTPTVYEFYENNVVDAKRYTTSESADASFQAFLFKGVPMIFDRDVPSGKMYFLNSNVVYWVSMKGAEMAVTPFEPATVNGQLARVALIHIVGNLVSTEPRMLHELTGVTE